MPHYDVVILGAPGILLALVVRFTLREPARGLFDGKLNAETGPTIAETAGVLWQCRPYRYLALFLVADGFLQFSGNNWVDQRFQSWTRDYNPVFAQQVALNNPIRLMCHLVEDFVVASVHM